MRHKLASRHFVLCESAACNCQRVRAPHHLEHIRYIIVRILFASLDHLRLRVSGRSLLRLSDQTAPLPSCIFSPSASAVPRRAMVYVPASAQCRFPSGPMAVWRAKARSIRKTCGLDAEKWQRAEEESLEMALWAAAFAKCAKGRGMWILSEYGLKRAWLDELQGKRLAQLECAN